MVFFFSPWLFTHGNCLIKMGQVFPYFYASLSDCLIDKRKVKLREKNLI